MSKEEVYLNKFFCAMKQIRDFLCESEDVSAAAYDLADFWEFETDIQVEFAGELSDEDLLETLR